MSANKTYDFSIDRRGICRVFRINNHSDVIAVCSCPQDAMIVVDALHNALDKPVINVDEVCAPFVEEALDDYQKKLFSPQG